MLGEFTLMNLDILTAAIIAFLAILGLYFAMKCRSDFSDEKLEGYINLNENIVVLTNKEKIVNINKAGLDFFGYKTTKSFKVHHKYISKLFTELSPKEEKFVYGIDWVTKIHKKQNIKVEMIEDGLKQTFFMQVKKVNNNRYLISFYNISIVMAQISNITKVAEKDELTKIYNRSKFNSLLSSSMRKSLVNNEPFSLIILDVDHFKKINDTYGHDMGDSVLKDMASIIKSELRDRDNFARWGGEEFVVLAESLAEKEASDLSERLRKAIEEYKFDRNIKVTCSFGVTQFRFSDTESSILKRADEALYVAKDNGRNQVRIFED